MPKLLLPPLSTVFNPILASPVFTGQPSYQKKLEQVLLAAAEAEAILAPILKRGTSWTSISQAAFTELATLEAQGVIPTDISSTVQSALTTSVNIQNSAEQLVSVTSAVTSGNLTQSLSALNTISQTLRTDTGSLYNTLNVMKEQETVVTQGATGISNSNLETITVFSASKEVAEQNLKNLNESIVFVSSSLISAKTQNLITGNNSQVAEAQQVLNQATANVAQVTSIANNLNSTIKNIQGIANNLKSFKSLTKFTKKRSKGRKQLYPIPSFLNPANNQYVKMYNELNDIIKSANIALQTIQQLGKTAAGLDIF